MVLLKFRILQHRNSDFLHKIVCLKLFLALYLSYVRNMYYVSSGWMRATSELYNAELSCTKTLTTTTNLWWTTKL